MMLQICRQRLIVGRIQQVGTIQQGGGSTQHFHDEDDDAPPGVDAQVQRLCHANLHGGQRPQHQAPGMYTCD